MNKMNKRELLMQKMVLESYIDETYHYLNSAAGLCGYVLSVHFDLRDILASWPDRLTTEISFNTNLYFPIEGDFDLYVEDIRKHDRNTENGKRRLSLAKHCLKHVIIELKDRK
jgi:hypothetical protein